MADRTIRIDRLRVRLHGTSPEASRRVADDLGRSLADRLAPELGRAGFVRSSIAHLDVTVTPPASAVSTGPGATPAARIADAVASTIGQRLPGRRSRP